MSEDFFGFDEDEEQAGLSLRHRSKWRWIGVVIVLIALVLGGLLMYGGLRSLSVAKQDEPYAGHSWVMSGEFVTSTDDLKTKTFNGVYHGNLPKDSNVSYQKFDGGVNDPADVKSGQQVQFRGTQTGETDSDFPRQIDALVAVDHGVMKVVQTDDAGSLSPVTDGSIAKARWIGWLEIIGACLVIAAGAYGVVHAVKRTRAEEDAVRYL